jgi:hypothetical protein
MKWYFTTNVASPRWTIMLQQNVIQSTNSVNIKDYFRNTLLLVLCCLTLCRSLLFQKSNLVVNLQQSSSVVLLDIGSKVRGFKPVRGRQILKAIKIRSTTSFRKKVKWSACWRTLSIIKVILHRQNSRTFLAKLLSASLLDVSGANRELW